MSTIKIGDKITFRSTTRDGTKTATRIVNGFYYGKPTVRFRGWRNFVVKHYEIIEVVAA